jgi:hypothetical protein
MKQKEDAMAKKKKLNIWKTIKLVFKDERVGRLLWLVARALLDDGRIDHAERIVIKKEAMDIVEDIICGD